MSTKEPNYYSVLINNVEYMVCSEHEISKFLNALSSGIFKSNFVCLAAENRNPTYFPKDAIRSVTQTTLTGYSTRKYTLVEG